MRFLIPFIRQVKPRPHFTRQFSAWTTQTTGTRDTLEWRMFFDNKEESKRISPWHDIPMTAEGGMYNYINEIPKGERAKMEVATDEDQTPIKQDTKKGKLRYFAYGDMPFNYGCIPQTWEDPNSVHPSTGYVGDNDPVDVVEIGSDPLEIGSVTPVKLIGIMALIDEEETDWKVIAIRKDHALASVLHDVDDLETHLPGTVEAIREWFRMYKTADGKPENKFSFDEKALGKEFAKQIVEETHTSYKELLAGIIPNKKGLVLK